MQIKGDRSNTFSPSGGLITNKWIDGELSEEDISEAFVNEMLAREQQTAEALADERIPRQYHGPIKKYFTHTIEDLPADKVRAARKKTKTDQEK
jgi:hypothetical protein